MLGRRQPMQALNPSRSERVVLGTASWNCDASAASIIRWRGGRAKAPNPTRHSRIARRSEHLIKHIRCLRCQSGGKCHGVHCSVSGHPKWIRRTRDGKAVIVALNFTEKEQTVSLDLAPYGIRRKEGHGIAQLVRQGPTDHCIEQYGSGGLWHVYRRRPVRTPPIRGSF